MKLRLLLSSCSLLLLLTACSPEPVFRLSPETEPSTFYKGAEYISLENDGVVVTMAYYRHWGNRFAMDVEVFNNGDTPFRVDPARFYREAFKHYEDSELRGFISYQWAIDPELEMLEIDKAISRTHSSRVSDKALFLTLSGIYIAAVLATGSDYDSEESEVADDPVVESSVQIEARAHDYHYEVRDLEQKRELWELETMRITDLRPDDYIRGLVFFPHEPKAAGYKIILDIDGKRIETWYEQKKFKP